MEDDENDERRKQDVHEGAVRTRVGECESSTVGNRTSSLRVFRRVGMGEAAWSAGGADGAAELEEMENGGRIVCSGPH